MLPNVAAVGFLQKVRVVRRMAKDARKLEKEWDAYLAARSAGESAYSRVNREFKAP